MSQIDSAAATSAQVVRILLTYNSYLEVIILLSVALPWNMDCELPPQTAGVRDVWAAPFLSCAKRCEDLTTSANRTIDYLAILSNT